MFARHTIENHAVAVVSVSFDKWAKPGHALAAKHNKKHCASPPLLNGRKGGLPGEAVAGRHLGVGCYGNLGASWAHIGCFGGG